MMRSRPPVGRAQWAKAGKGPAVATSVVIHGVIGGTLLAGPAVSSQPMPPVYRVELVAAPARDPSERRRPEVVERPSRQTEAIPDRPRPRPNEPTPAPVSTKPDLEPAAKAPPVEPPPPDVTPSTGTDLANVKTTGVEFPYPSYLRNIVAQVYRRWQRPAGNLSLRAEVVFFIRRDGSMTNLRFVRRSGNFSFDLEAQGAIEAAANSGAFGPLPEGFPSDVLAVNFFFDPSSPAR